MCKLCIETCKNCPPRGKPCASCIEKLQNNKEPKAQKQQQPQQKKGPGLLFNGATTNMSNVKGKGKGKVLFVDFHNVADCESQRSW